MSDQEPTAKRKRIHQTLPEDLHRRLKARAAAEGRPLQDLIEAILRWAADKNLNGNGAHA